MSERQTVATGTKAVRPASVLVEISALIGGGYLVKIKAQAIITED